MHKNTKLYYEKYLKKYFDISINRTVKVVNQWHSNTFKLLKKNNVRVKKMPTVHINVWEGFGEEKAKDISP